LYIIIDKRYFTACSRSNRRAMQNQNDNEIEELVTIYFCSKSPMGYHFFKWL